MMAVQSQPTGLFNLLSQPQRRLSAPSAAAAPPLPQTLDPFSQLVQSFLTTPAQMLPNPATIPPPLSSSSILPPPPPPLSAGDLMFAYFPAHVRQQAPPPPAPPLYGNIPPAPPMYDNIPPPPPMSFIPPPPAPPMDIYDDIPAPPAESSRTDLLSAIRHGTQLRRVSPTARAPPSPPSTQATLAAHFASILNRPSPPPPPPPTVHERYRPPVPRELRQGLRQVAAAAAAAARGVPEAPPMSVEEKKHYGIDGALAITKQQHAEAVTKAVAAAVAPRETIIRGLKAEIGSLSDELTLLRSDSKMNHLQQQLELEQQRNAQLIDLLLHVVSNGTDGHAASMAAVLSSRSSSSSSGSSGGSVAAATSSSGSVTTITRDSVLAHATTLRSQWISQREQTIKRLNETLDNTKECLVCADRARTVVFMPCGHVCACVKCSEVMTSCPVCRVSVTDRIRAFIW